MGQHDLHLDLGLTQLPCGDGVGHREGVQCLLVHDVEDHICAVPERHVDGQFDIVRRGWSDWKYAGIIPERYFSCSTRKGCTANRGFHNGDALPRLAYLLGYAMLLGTCSLERQAGM